MCASVTDEGGVCKPSLWNPFKAIRAPYIWIPISCENRNDDVGIVRDWNFVNFFPVEAFDGYRKRHDNILTGPTSGRRGMYVMEYNLHQEKDTYFLETYETGG